MQIKVQLELCMGNAQCMIAAPEVFEVREDGLVYILQDHPPDALRTKVEEAARLCPTQAITIEPA